MREQKRYNVGVYCRLSKDDDIRSGESSSISTQKEMLEKYVKDKGWTVFGCYIDDGYSGTNFNRPDFQRMIDDVEDGKVNLVVVKDLSRLGRNYLATGQYTEVYFPDRGVRFIALNDGIDTLNSDNDIAPFKNILNEMYAKDCSNKVRTALRAKKQQGKFLSAHAPMGYQKDPKDKHRLIVEETGSVVVKRIFEMSRSGLGSKKICKILNDEGVPTTRNHRKILLGEEPKPNKRWLPEVVIALLRNRTYLGDTVQGMMEYARFGRTPPKIKPKEEWIITPNTHEPLVDVETWEFAQKLIDSRLHPTRSKEVHMFAGLLKCEDCGYTLGYSTQKDKSGDAYYCCGQYRRHGKKFCTNHYIRKDTLEQVVLDDILEYSRLAEWKADELTEQLLKQNGDKDEKEMKILTTDLKKLNARYTELDVIMKRLYEDNVTGKLTDDRFNKFLTDYEAEQSGIYMKIENAEQEIERIKANKKDTDSFVKLIRNYTTIKGLDRTVLVELIDKIVIGQSKTIDGHKTMDITIYYRFIGAID